MSLDGEVVTPSTERYQPQHVIGRQQFQLRAPSDYLQQTGNGNQPREDDVIAKMASQVTVDVINSAVRAYAAEQNGYDPLSRNREPTEIPSDAVQPPSTTETSLATSGSGEVEDKQLTGNQSAGRSVDVAAVPSHHSQPETVSSTGGDGPKAEALQDVARLQAITRQLRAVVAESRSADGLPIDVDDNQVRTTNKEHDDTVECLLLH